MLNKKQSKVEVMNISFDIPSLAIYKPIACPEPNRAMKGFHTPEYSSSMRVIKIIKPKDIIFVNLPPGGRLFNCY